MNYFNITILVEIIMILLIGVGSFVGIWWGNYFALDCSDDLLEKDRLDLLEKDRLDRLKTYNSDNNKSNYSLIFKASLLVKSQRRSIIPLLIFYYVNTTTFYTMALNLVILLFVGAGKMLHVLVKMFPFVNTATFLTMLGCSMSIVVLVISAISMHILKNRLNTLLDQTIALNGQQPSNN